MWNVAVKARTRCCPQRRGDGEGPPSKPSAQCPVIPAIEASVRKVQQLLWPSSPRA